MIQDCMRKAAPQAHQVLAISNKFLVKVHGFMTSKNEHIAARKAGYYLMPAGSKTLNATQLETYRKACAGFRTEIADATAFPTQESTVLTVLEPGAYANDLKFILL